MTIAEYSQQELVLLAKLSSKDIEKIQERRQPYTRLGFAYQLAFVRLTNRVPGQRPFEITEDILTYVSVQLDIFVESGFI